MNLEFAELDKLAIRRKNGDKKIIYIVFKIKVNKLTSEEHMSKSNYTPTPLI